MKLEQALVKSHAPLTPDYRLLELACPAIASEALPGQFVHLRIPRLDDALLRRPFSILDAKDGVVSILYKAVGRGTVALVNASVGDSISLIGPLGKGFPIPKPTVYPVLIAGGYGVAPMKFLASRMTQKGTLFIGGRSKRDIFLDDVLTGMGWDVQVTTEDGSQGRTGRVTVALDDWMAARTPDMEMEVYVCGPDGLLHAVCDRAVANQWTAWISMDRHMGCGVGACLACVQMVKKPDGKNGWIRVCTEGPVLTAQEIVW